MIATIDMAAAVLGAAMLGGAIGFMTCALFASATIRRNRQSDFQDGYECCNRDHHNSKYRPHRQQ